MCWTPLYACFNLVVAAVDLSRRRVANAVILAGLLAQSLWLLAAATLDISAHYALTAWQPALFALLLVFVLLFPLWKLRLMGAGDVKYLAVLGYAIGAAQLLPVVLIASLLAGGHAVLVVSSRYSPGLALRIGRNPAWRRIPYAAYLALAALACLAWALWQ